MWMKAMRSSTVCEWRPQLFSKKCWNVKTETEDMNFEVQKSLADYNRNVMPRTQSNLSA